MTEAEDKDLREMRTLILRPDGSLRLNEDAGSDLWWWPFGSEHEWLAIRGVRELQPCDSR